MRAVFRLTLLTSGDCVSTAQVSSGVLLSTSSGCGGSCLPISSDTTSYATSRRRGTCKLAIRSFY